MQEARETKAMKSMCTWALWISGLKSLSFAEAWYTSRSDVVNFDGHKYEGRYRENKRGGEIALYFRDNIAFDVMHELSVMNAHCKSLVVKCSGTIIHLVYRPPSGSINDFLLYIDDLVARKDP